MDTDIDGEVFQDALRHHIGGGSDMMLDASDIARDSFEAGWDSRGREAQARIEVLEEQVRRKDALLDEIGDFFSDMVDRGCDVLVAESVCVYWVEHIRQEREDE